MTESISQSYTFIFSSKNLYTKVFSPYNIVCTYIKYIIFLIYKWKEITIYENASFYLGSLYRQLRFVTFTVHHLRNDKTFQLKAEM